jgi:pimeloyl-ACP methyl ester carboxylesterase
MNLTPLFLTLALYDRAGLGWSDPSPYPRDAVTMALELHTMLKNANIKAPYVLVGHSLGGVVARHFVAKYPADALRYLEEGDAQEKSSSPWHRTTNPDLSGGR